MYNDLLSTQYNYHLISNTISSTIPSEEEVSSLKDKIEEIASYIEKNWKSLLIKSGITLAIFLSAWYFLNRSKNKFLGKIQDVIKRMEDKATSYLDGYIKLNRFTLQFEDYHLNKIKKALSVSGDINSFTSNLFSQLDKDNEKDDKLHSFIDFLKQSKEAKIFEVDVLRNYFLFTSHDKEEILKFQQKILNREKYQKWVKVLIYIFSFIIASGLFLYFFSKSKTFNKIFSTNSSFSDFSGNIPFLGENEFILKESINLKNFKNFITLFKNKILKPTINKVLSLPTWAIFICGFGIAFLIFLLIKFKKQQKLKMESKETSFLDFIFSLWKKNALNWKGIILFSFLTCSSAIFLFFKGVK